MVLNLGLFIYHVLPGLPQDGGLVVSGVVRWVTQSETSGIEVGAWSGRFVIIAAGAVFLGGPLVMSRQLPRLVDAVVGGGTDRGAVALDDRAAQGRTRRHITDQILTRSITRPTETVPRHTASTSSTSRTSEAPASRTRRRRRADRSPRCGGRRPSAS